MGGGRRGPNNKNEKSQPPGQIDGRTRRTRRTRVRNVITTKIILTALQSAEAGEEGGDGEKVDLNARACPRGTRRGGPSRATTARVNTVRPL